MELFQELLLTAFVALVIYFLIAKLVSIATADNDDNGKLGKKGVNETVKLDRGLKVEGGSKSKKRVRFAVVEEFVGKVDRFSGEGSAVESIEERWGNKGELIEEIVAEGKGVNAAFDEFLPVAEKIKVADDDCEMVAAFVGERSDNIGNEVDMVIDTLDELIVAENNEIEEANDKTYVELIKDGVVGDQSGEGGRVLEEGVVDERNESVVKGGPVSYAALDELIVSAKNENEEVDHEKIFRLISDDVIADQSEDAKVLGKSVVEKRSDSNLKEGNMVENDLNELIGVEKNENVGFGDDKSVGLSIDDSIADQSGGVKILKELAVKERSESSAVEEKRVNTGSDKAVSGKIENDEADFKSGVELANENAADQSGKVNVLKDMVVKERSESSPAFDTVDFSEKIENVKADDEMGAELDNENLAGGQSGEIPVKEVLEDQGNGSGGEMNEGNGEREGLVSDEDDDWEGIERTEVEKVFAMAASYVDGGGRDNSLLNLGSDVQMQLYGLHKVATEGPCYDAQPMALKVSARAKWVDSCYV